MSKLIYGLFFNSDHVFLNTSETSIAVLLSFLFNFFVFLNNLSRGWTVLTPVYSILLPITCRFSGPLFHFLYLLFLVTRFSLFLLFKTNVLSGVFSFANKLEFEILNSEFDHNVTSVGKVKVVGYKSSKKLSGSSIIIGISDKVAGSEDNDGIRNSVRSISIGRKKVLMQVSHLHYHQ